MLISLPAWITFDTSGRFGTVLKQIRNFGHPSGIFVFPGVIPSFQPIALDNPKAEWNLPVCTAVFQGKDIAIFLSN